MTRNLLVGAASCVVIAVGLLSAPPTFAQQQNGTDLSPAKSNCDSPTGCASYSSGNVTNQNPVQPRNSTSAQGAGSDLSPAKSNCDSPTGCASYSTGNTTTTNPANAAPKSK